MKAGQSEPRADEGLLHRVGGVVRRAERASGKGQQAMLVALDELLEREAIASLRPRDERCVRIFHE